MAKTKEIRQRIKAVKNTAKITKAMQLVAASKMKRAQDTALQGRPYAILLRRILALLNGQAGEFKHPFLEEREVKTRGILLVSTDRGLCGPLNSNLFRELVKIDGEKAFVTVGKKGTQFVSRTGRKLLASFSIAEGVPFNEVRPIAEFMLEQFMEGHIDTIEVLYPRFRNTLIQEPTLMPLLPLTNLKKAVEANAKAMGEELAHDNREFIFEPDATTILDKLMDRFFKQQVFQLILDSRASEHSSRMVAMKAATDNAKKLTDDLTLQFNKARQAAITQEILEITAAANM
ncbi:MAG: ATP synthase F1 subunit gamma [Verrucomicrobiota bacterium]